MTENGAPLTLSLIQGRLGDRFGVLAESNTNQLTVIARNADVAVGDLFLLPSSRGSRERLYIFRTTQYANVLNRALEMGDLARTKLTMEDAYFSEDLAEEQLIELQGMVMGYAERAAAGWAFHRPRRLPEHLSDVYHVQASNPHIGPIMEALLHDQLGAGGLPIGHLLAGEDALSVPVYLPPFALAHHIGVFGRTGSGKSNLMMVLLRAALQHNVHVLRGQRPGPAVSLLAIDPHDEFRRWHADSGGADGLEGLLLDLPEVERRRLAEPFYYLTAQDADNVPFGRRVQLSRADLIPTDLASITEFSEQQVAFANQQFARWGEGWIQNVLMGAPPPDGEFDDVVAEFLPGTVAAVQRRLDFLRRGHTRVVVPFDPALGDPYTSDLPDLLCALEAGRVLVLETTLMGELEQFLLNTVVARTLFVLRRALRSVDRPADLEAAVRRGLGNDNAVGHVGLRALADALVERIEDGRLPYLTPAGRLASLDALPYVNVVIEEAPSVLNPQRMRFGSVFRDISRQGRKFRIGLTVVSQQVSEIDRGVLTQLNTELFLSLGNEAERREAVRNASADLGGFERELQVMARGQAVLTASYKDVPLPIQIPDFDTLGPV